MLARILFSDLSAWANRQVRAPLRYVGTLTLTQSLSTHYSFLFLTPASPFITLSQAYETSYFYLIFCLTSDFPLHIRLHLL